VGVNWGWEKDLQNEETAGTVSFLLPNVEKMETGKINPGVLDQRGQGQKVRRTSLIGEIWVAETESSRGGMTVSYKKGGKKRSKRKKRCFKGHGFQ